MEKYPIPGGLPTGCRYGLQKGWKAGCPYG